MADGNRPRNDNGPDQIDKALASGDRALAFRLAKSRAYDHSKAEDAWQRLARVAEQCGQPYTALRALEEIKLRFDSGTRTYARIGRIFTNLKKYRQAEFYFKEALDRDPRDPESLIGLLKLPQIAETDPQIAVDSFATLCSVQESDDPEVWRAAGAAKSALGYQKDVYNHYLRARERFPDAADFKIKTMMHSLFFIYDSEKEVERQRALFARHLEKLTHFVEQDAQSRLALLGSFQNFHPFRLPYQGHCDINLQRNYGALLARCLHQQFGNLPPRPESRVTAKPPRQPIRLGVISAAFHRHAGWRNRRGWFYHLNPDIYQTYVYDIGAHFDDVKAYSYGAFDYIRAGQKSLGEWVRLIRGDTLDIVVYPELGMDGATYALAATRLAPVQCVSFGHPETTGLPTIDYMLSSDFMEPEEGHKHYTEQLVRLPGTGFYRYPLDYKMETANRQDFELYDDDIVFFYGHNTIKILPYDDEIFVEIARRCSRARFLFIRDPRSGFHQALRSRLERAFSAAGLKMDVHCRFFPKMPTRDFAGVIGMSDIYLDCPSWNGNNVTVDAFRQSLPPVTLAGPLMRQRHTYGLMKRMGLESFCCHEKEEMIAYAVHLANNPEARQHLGGLVRDNYHRIFYETDCLAAVDDFFRSQVR